MITNLLAGMRDYFHAQLCYQLFITPLPLPLEKEYRDFASRACEFLIDNRTEIIEFDKPRHHVIHHFAPEFNSTSKKVLITHGWMSRAAYMASIIRFLVKEGYDVYALDFPAHGEARGIQLTWHDSVLIIRETLENLGPFYAVIGHSFGGSMILNTLNLASQFPEWKIKSLPEKAVLMASPTNMKTPVTSVAKRFKLSRQSFVRFNECIVKNSLTHIKHLNYQNFISRGTIPFLCIHGQDDATIHPQESILFCRRYPHASLALLPNLDHVQILVDGRIERIICNFLH